jgi:hypothetical protein
MALQDMNLVLSDGQVLTATAASTYIYDIELGTRITTTFVTNAPEIIGNATYFGEDLGLGRGVGTPTVEVFSGSGTPITATGLTIAFQGAPNNVTAQASGNVSDLTFVIYIQTDELLLASILPSIRLACFDVPRRRVGSNLPRFYRLNYTVDGSNFSGLTLYAYINLGGTSAQATLGQYAANY